MKFIYYMQLTYYIALPNGIFQVWHEESCVSHKKTCQCLCSSTVVPDSVIDAVGLVTA